MVRNIQREQGQQSGIYKITNLLNGKYYLGSTKNISSRYRSHLYTLNNNLSGSIILQNAVNKYGIDNFEFSVVEVCDNYKEREIELLNEDFPDYNIVLETKVGREFSDETKRKMSEAQKLAYKNGRPKTSKKGRKFIRHKKSSLKVFDLEQNSELVFNSVKEAAEYFNCVEATIYTAIYRENPFRKRYKLILIKP